MSLSSQSFEFKFNYLQNYMKEKSSYESVSSEFSKLTTNWEKVRFAFDCLEESQALQVNLLSASCKCDEVSASYRLKGNKKYLQKNDFAAIRFYSLSVAYASHDSEELSVAFANRSAVTFSLKEYSASLEDIERALIGNYPEERRYKLFERKGKCLKSLGSTALAKEAFHMALKSLPQTDLDENRICSAKSALEKLIAECLGDKKVRDSERCLPCLQDKNEVILSASALLRIEYSSQFGRHLVAAADIEPGEILVVEEPFASVLLPTAYNTHCFYCKKRCHSLLPCLHCVTVMYCSEFCRSADLDKSHKIECKLIPHLLELDFNKIELIAVRTLLVATRKFKSLKEFIELAPNIKSNNDPLTYGLDENGHYNSSDYRTVHHLVGNEEYRLNADIFRRAAVAAIIVWLMEQCTDYFAPLSDCDSSKENVFTIGGLLLKYLMIVASNAHEISEMMVWKNGGVQSESQEVGGALYPLLSLLNHSCDPNVVRHSYNGDLNVLSAIQVIRAGDQICDNYGYHHAVHDVNMRRSKLRDQYLFHCECVACQEDWPFFEKLPNSNPVYLRDSLKGEVEKSSEIFEEVLNDVKSGKTEGKLGFLYAHLALLHRAVRRPWSEYSACQEAIKQCLSRQANHYVMRSSS